MTRLILIRHGETEANVQRVWQGSFDAPLTPQGEAQVEATARRVAAIQDEFPIDHIFVSPLPRAQSTAKAIADATGLAPIVEEGLREFDLGDWEGRSFQELAEEDRLWERWQKDPTFAPTNGESPVSFGRRVSAAFARLVETHPGETLLVVTHGGVISNLLAQWLGEGAHEWSKWDPPNCAITILERERDGWRTLCVNDTDHLVDVGVVREDWTEILRDGRG